MNIALILKGAAMGIAEAVPGVSGGTIAFITGIYQELLRTIKSFTPQNISLLLSDRASFWKEINGTFLLQLLIGMVGGLVGGILIIGNLLENHQILLWAFFFGLVLASAFFLARDIKWGIKQILPMLIGAVMTYMITTLPMISGSDNLLYMFLGGCLAISALMLPGLSGSFILLLLGLYHVVVTGLKDLISEFDTSQLLPLIVFSLGALVGLFTFARLLSFLFKRYERTTMATMIGILIGSLNKLWPWKKITAAVDKESGDALSLNTLSELDPDTYKIVQEANLLPQDFALIEDPKLIIVGISCLLGVLLIAILSKNGMKDSK